MQPYLYLLLGVLIILVFVIMLAFAGVLFFRSDLILKQRIYQKHKSSHPVL